MARLPAASAQVEEAHLRGRRLVDLPLGPDPNIPSVLMNGAIRAIDV